MDHYLLFFFIMFDCQLKSTLVPLLPLSIWSRNVPELGLFCHQINGIEVLRVIRKGGDAIHYFPAPLDPGTEVELHVDWCRRWDHMQQHSGMYQI